ncbi:S-adenosyl-L-methionine-dependent methyltransferase [Daldinia sp. FL1419]|nr:S-adenosyl-L-methionine-dependent methyltransferase [Daldinia sp. FL1419]
MADTTAKTSSPKAAMATTATSAASPGTPASPKDPTSPRSPGRSATPEGEAFGTEQHIEVADDLEEPDDNDDANSAVGSSIQSSTGSLTESIYAYRVLHGRTFNAPKTSEYWAPNDEQQNEGLDLLHNACLMAMGDELFLAPIGENPQKVLDVGTGTGIWAIDFADVFPAAEVIGTDLSPIQPAWMPPNVKFEIDDCLLDWTWPENHFDYIHMRMLYGSVPDWTDLYKKAFKHLKPGKWFEDVEFDVRIQSDHATITEDHMFNTWAEAFYEAGDKLGRSFRIAYDGTLKESMIMAGFVDVHEVKVKMPCHGWPRDPKLQQAGLLMFAMLDQSLEGFCLYLFSKAMGWTAEEILLFVAKYRTELKKKSLCGWLLVTIVYGRKPEVGEV